jgi:hypothetical protein
MISVRIYMQQLGRYNMTPFQMTDEGVRIVATDQISITPLQLVEDLAAQTLVFELCL